MNNLNIQIANKSDISYISNNLNTKYLCSWNKIEFLTCANMQSSTIYVYKDNLSILGFLCIQKTLNEIEILNICTNINFRHKGIAKSLLNYLISSITANDNIFLEVNVNNKFAIDMYKKIGFKIISERKEYYLNKITNTKENAYVMIFKEE